MIAHAPTPHVILVLSRIRTGRAALGGGWGRNRSCGNGVGRRRHSAEFKAELVAACRQLGVSSAAVALTHSINANLLRRWVAEAESANGPLTESPAPFEAFVALPMPTRSSADTLVRIEVRRGPLTKQLPDPPCPV
jgi:transposase-like protein